MLAGGNTYEEPAGGIRGILNKQKHEPIAIEGVEP
jgi:hypothetical protein